MKLEWNAGGWFGSQFGGTAWILVAAVLSAIRDVSMGFVLLGIFAVPNVIGYMFWHRKNLSCYAATQWLIALMGTCGLLAIYVLDRGRLWQEIQTGGSVSTLSAYGLVVLVVVVLMLTFYLRFGRKEDGPAT